MPRTKGSTGHRADARRHAKARASARLGIVLNRDDLNGIVQAIQSGSTIPLWSQSLTRAWHLVKVRDVPCVVIYGKALKAVHTFLTLDMARETLAKNGQVAALKKLEAA